MKATVLTGLDRFSRYDARKYRGARFGLLAHQASVSRELQHTIDVVTARGCHLRAVFAPEHGLSGTEQALRPVGSERLRRLPVYSLYGNQLRPTPEMLAGLDFFLFDLQDVGSRYYTYISTMLYCFRACGEANVEFIVLDRPNPIGGKVMEGNLIEPTHLSYVGIHPLPARHGMTVGEIALMFKDQLSLRGKLTVIPMTGWKRDNWYDETNLPWVMPSPNMPTLDTATVYPGMCLLEGTNLSEGRGTTRPFELFGAPWLDSARVAQFLRGCRLPGLVFRETRFKPTFNTYSGEVCHGFQMHVVDRLRFKPYLTAIAILQGCRAIHKKKFAWRPPPYEYETIKLPIDILLGSSSLRRMIENEIPIREIERGWREKLDVFARVRRHFLLY